MRLEGKVAIVVGAGQTPGDTIGNGRAAAVLFARHGARIVALDRNRASVDETCAMIESEGGVARAVVVDVTRDVDCKAAVQEAMKQFGRVDILHNNVGTGQGDAGPTHVTDETLDAVFDVNFKGPLRMCRHTLPIMREQGSGVILNVSSIASICAVGLVAYKSSKAALNALTHTLAAGNAKYGIRANAILPGLMNTPMAVEGIASARGIDKQQLIAARDALVPLGGKMGTAWDVAHAALFLASDEAKFITGVLLPVDGGQSVRVG